jgi:hypothetical protein
MGAMVNDLAWSSVGRVVDIAANINNTNNHLSHQISEHTRAIF